VKTFGRRLYEGNTLRNLSKDKTLVLEAD